MKIATWNVNSLTARWPRVETWLIDKSPDVVLIQETKQTDAKFPFAELAALGYESAHYGQGQWNGVAIFSRVGLDDVTRGFGDDDPEARIVSATCGDVRVHSCYVPNGRALDDPHYAYKLRWLANLERLVESRDRSTHVVVGGDFNVAPTDFDCYDPSAFVGATHVSEPEREALRRLERAGLVDLTRSLNPMEPCFSWWDYRNGSFRRGWGLRIDLLYVDQGLYEKATASYVDRDARKGEKPSDHAPVVGEFAL
ncbi:MAG TPA: exodeoxyribonuclease III [Acidimicrobiales bacterium]|nr:exodeoxyribonuclease III [Acidimicrobiales bacterium]